MKDGTKEILTKVLAEAFKRSAPKRVSRKQKGKMYRAVSIKLLVVERKH